MRHLLHGLVLALALALPGAARAQDNMLLGLKVFELGGDNWADAGQVIERAALHPMGLLVVRQDAPQDTLPGPLPGALRILDLRFGEGINLVRGHHPRLQGYWTQYSGLSTGLRQNMILSDVIRPDAQTYNWKSQKKAYSPLAYKDPAEYAHNHNHYQNFLSEVWNFNSHVNGVAIWGDASALAQDSKTWGAFFSARSWPLNWKEYVPEGRGEIDPAKFDAQLVGVEIDVLNGGKPWGEPGAWSKTGLQIVGFGKTNSQAIEIRSEDTESPDWANRKGTWATAMIVHKALDPKIGRVIYGAFEHGFAGIDFDHPLFQAGALRFRSEAANQGIVVNGGRGGQIYADGKNVMTVGGAEGGVRLATAGGRAMLGIDHMGVVRVGPEDRPVINVDPSGSVTVLRPDGRAAFGVAADGSLFAGKRSLAYALVRDILQRHPVAVGATVAGGLALLLALQALVAVVVVRRLRVPKLP